MVYATGGRDAHVWKGSEQAGGGCDIRSCGYRAATCTRDRFRSRYTCTWLGFIFLGERIRSGPSGPALFVVARHLSAREIQSRPAGRCSRTTCVVGRAPHGIDQNKRNREREVAPDVTGDRLISFPFFRVLGSKLIQKTNSTAIIYVHANVCYRIHGVCSIVRALIAIAMSVHRRKSRSTTFMPRRRFFSYEYCLRVCL